MRSARKGCVHLNIICVLGNSAFGKVKSLCIVSHSFSSFLMKCIFDSMIFYYRLKEPILHLLWASWTCFSVITSPNRNLSGWNLECKWGAMVHTHTRKMEELVPAVLPQGDKTCFVSSVINSTQPFGYLSCTNFDHFWNNRRESLFACVHWWKILQFLHRDFPGSQNSPKYGTLG